MHPELVRVGFLDFVARQRTAGFDHLFPELKFDRRGYRSDAIQKKLNRQIVRAGAAAPRTTFHSLRHCFRDAVREADVSRDAVLALGWKAGGVEEIYGGGLRASTLAREIAKVRYDLDLSHLHLRGVRTRGKLPDMLPGADPLRDMIPDEITSFIEGHEWRFAKNMPEIPHSYVVKKDCRSAEEFERFVIHIRRNGYRGKFDRAYYTYLDWPVDGVIHQFWTRGAPSVRDHHPQPGCQAMRG